MSVGLDFKLFFSSFFLFVEMAHDEKEREKKETKIDLWPTYVRFTSKAEKSVDEAFASKVD
jgi:hypothetical protein